MKRKVHQAKKEAFKTNQNFSLIKNNMNRTILVDFDFKRASLDNTSYQPITTQIQGAFGTYIPDAENCKPTFLHDGYYFTPSFVLGVDKKEYVQNVDFIRQKFENRKNQDFKEKQQLFIPKPVSKTRTCNVCKTTYDDYLEHCDSYSHKSQLKKVKFTKEILKLCKMHYRRQKEKMTRSNKKSRNSTNRICHSNRDEEKLLFTVSTVEEDLMPQEIFLLQTPRPLIEF